MNKFSPYLLNYKIISKAENKTRRIVYTDGDVEDLSLQEIRKLVENYGKKMSRARTRDKKKVAKAVGNAGNTKSMEKIQEVVPPTKAAPRIRIKMQRKLKVITGAVKDGEGGALTDPRIDMTKNDGDSADLKRKRVEKPRQNSADEKAEPELKLSFQELREDFIRKRKKTSPGLTSSSNAISNDVDALNQGIRRKVGRPVGPKKKFTLPMHDLVGRQSEVRTTNAPRNKAHGISVHSTLTEKSSQPQKRDEVRTLNIPAKKSTTLTDRAAPLAKQHDVVRTDSIEVTSTSAETWKQSDDVRTLNIPRLKAEEAAKIKAEEEERLRKEAKALTKKEEERIAAEELAKKEEEERIKAEALVQKEKEERRAAEALAKKQEAQRLTAEALAKKEEEERLAAEARAKRLEEERIAAEALSMKDE